MGSFVNAIIARFVLSPSLPRSITDTPHQPRVFIPAHCMGPTARSDLIYLAGDVATYPVSSFALYLPIPSCEAILYLRFCSLAPSKRTRLLALPLIAFEDVEIDSYAMSPRLYSLCVRPSSGAYLLKLPDISMHLFQSF
jgi:hypothetical protein